MTIKSSTYLNAVMTVKELSAKGINLTTRKASVLGDLLESSVSFQAPKTTNAESVLLRPNGAVGPVIIRNEEDLANEVQNNTANYETSSVHTLKIMALAEDLAPHISAHISHARNVVSPMVIDLAQKLEKFKETAKPLDPSSSFEIIKGIIPALLLDESFLADGIENYASMEVKSPDFIDIPTVPSDDFLNSLMNLGSERLNGLVQAWIKTKEQDFIKNCFLVNFTSSQNNDYFNENTLKCYLPSITSSTYRAMDVALACYLIASRLFAEPQSVQGMSLMEYKTKLRGWIDYAGSTAMKAMKNARRQQEANIVVNEAILSKKRIVVNNVVYQAWLEAGGSPEVLLGMLVSGQVHYAVSAIEENKAQLLRHWQNYLMLAKSDVNAEMAKRFRSYLESEVLLGLNELTESELDYAKNVATLSDIATSKIKEIIEHKAHCLMDDVYHTALCVIAKGRFYYTSTYDILNEMTEVAKQNPDIDVREAALLSVISYIADYFVAQIEVVK